MYYPTLEEVKNRRPRATWYRSTARSWPTWRRRFRLPEDQPRRLFFPAGERGGRPAAGPLQLHRHRALSDHHVSTRGEQTDPLPPLPAN